MADAAAGAVPSPVRIAVAGAAGRMGQEVLAVAKGDDAVQVALAFDRGDDAEALAQCGADVLIDFSAPAATLQFTRVCRGCGMSMVVGCTGFDDAQMAQLRAAGADIAVLFAQNMSVGVNALYRIAAFAARQLAAGRLGGGYDIEVTEEHHRHKKDAPSGTALRLGQALAQATGADWDEDAVFARHGQDAARGAHDIGFSVARGGDIVGTHRVLFAGNCEVLEITHRSGSRANYAAGALRAAKFVARAAPGFYDGMAAVLAADDDGAGESSHKLAFSRKKA